MRKTNRLIFSTLCGDVFTDFLGAQTGMPENPLSDDALFEKFRACTAFAGWSENRTKNTLDRLLEIDGLNTIRSLMRGEA